MKYLVIFIPIIFLSSCYHISDDIPDDTAKVLRMAGNNRSELERVLEYYRGDSLKFRAACFLIANMADEYAIVPTDTSDIYIRSFPELKMIHEEQAWEPSISKIGAYLDSIRSIKKPQMTIIRDINVITADFLIENIDLAFTAWEKFNGSDAYAFEAFCEYVLPYRLEHEPLNHWRKTAYERFGHLLDSVTGGYDIAKRVVKSNMIWYNAGMSKFPYPLTLDSLLNLHWGDCDQMAYCLTAVLRAIGIPSAIDFTPVWANRSGGHKWNIVIDRKGHTVDMGFGHDASNEFAYKISKIYRLSFADQQYINVGKNNTAFSFFYHPDWKDVTSEYKDMAISDIRIKTNKKESEGYLCTFDNSMWIPVAKSYLSGDVLIFNTVGRGDFRKEQMRSYRNSGDGIVYLPVGIQNNRITPLAPPLILRENGLQTILKAELKKKQTIHINRKYPKYGHIIQYERMMLGGRFEASNRSDFSPKILLCDIKYIPDQPVKDTCINMPRSYRYVRYVAPEHSWANVGDIAFYSDTRKLHGIPFSSSTHGGGQDVNRAFDGNIDTYFHTNNENGAFVGLDFGHPERITRILYSPRTDNNDVIPGDEYELFYWGNEWCSLGKCIANGFELVYDNAPSNALFLLHNHTRGKEERPFTYEHGKQIWW